ncbi:putative uncharacterized protein DDB_G0283051 [Hermetia illucens]|uniref:putative uncharacterized protein DDB_G0283051 n=1 Tax=Hermetia illucens TaxID=343691 RepID=UPI0018CC2B57|nr:putative uncharacterized protein DDB_G0283051 [Hermetia illucens]
MTQGVLLDKIYELSDISEIIKIMQMRRYENSCIRPEFRKIKNINSARNVDAIKDKNRQSPSDSKGFSPKRYHSFQNQGDSQQTRQQTQYTTTNYNRRNYSKDYTQDRRNNPQSETQNNYNNNSNPNDNNHNREEYPNRSRQFRRSSGNSRMNSGCSRQQQGLLLWKSIMSNPLVKTTKIEIPIEVKMDPENNLSQT